MLIHRLGGTILLLTLLMFTRSHLAAQPYYFRHYQVENGLSNNTVFCSIQDNTGFMWFGTKEGLNRFDGYNFKLFKFHSDDKDWAERELIYCLFNDPKGNLWVGTQKGLFIFDKARELLLPRFPALDEVNAIQSDASGRLWFISRTKICRFDPIKNELKEFNPQNYFDAGAMCLTPDGGFWFASTNGKLQRYNSNTDQFTSFELYNHSPSFTSCSIEKITAAGDNSIYIGTTCQGIKEFNTITGEYKDLLIYNADKTPVYVRDILQYSPTEYWFATESGIFVLDKTTNSFTNIKKKFLDPYSLSDNAVYTICKDAEGGIWAGTYFGGVNHYAKQYATFKKYFADNSQNTLKGSAIREIRRDASGNIWIGTEDAGINKLNPVSGQIINFSPDGLPGSISYSNIHGLLPIGNELWIGTHEHGLDIADIRTGKLIKHYNEGPGPGDLKNNFILSILETKNNKIYLGTGNSVQTFDRQSGSFARCDGFPEHMVVSTLIEANDHTIWAGTHGSGLHYYNPITGEKGNFYNKAGDTAGLTANTINSIMEDSNGNIWIGTEGGGVVKMNRNKKIIQHLNTRDGLTSNFIFHIVEDKEKNIWLTSSKGLNRLSPDLRSIKIFTRSSGLLNDQFNYHSGYCDPDGTLYFGSVRGMISFRPDECRSSPIIPKVYITGLQVNNKELEDLGDSTISKFAITQSTAIKLRHDQSSFSLDFAALSYISPDMTKYQYIMEGVDKTWTELKTNRKVYFTDLSPGKYVFRVKASTDGQWTGEEAKLTITVHPPVWASDLAYLLYTFIAFSGIFIAVRFYYLRAKEKREKELYAAKIDFFTNVAHEIRTPLTLIKGPVENITEKIENYPEISADVHTLGRNTDRLISLVSGVLDFRKTETDGFRLHFSKVDVKQIIEENFLDFKPLAMKRNLQYELNVESDAVEAWADEDAVNKIISNLLSNAVKYADTYVGLTMNVTRTTIQVQVSSDGYKIPEQMKEKVFEPFFRMKETSKQKGAGIGLALARSLSELHNGHLYLRTDDPVKNVFQFELPLKNLNKEVQKKNTADLF